MNRRDTVVAAILALFLVLTVLGVVFRDLFVSPKPVVLCTNILWTGSIHHARDLGHLPTDAVKIVEFTSTYDSIRSLRSGAADAAMLTLDEALMLNSYSPNYRVIMIVDFSDGGDVVDARPCFKSIRDLKGKRIAIDGGTMGTYTLERALALSNLKPSDVTTVQIPLNQHEEAWAKGTIDASVTYGRFHAGLLNSGATNLFTSREIPQEILGVLVVRKSVIETNRKHLIQLISGWYHVQEHVRTHPDDAYQSIGRHQGTPPQVMREILSGFAIPDRKTCIDFLSSDKMLKIADRLNIIMVNAKLIPAPVPLDNIFDPSLAKEATP